jgi:hypothetical protein
MSNEDPLFPIKIYIYEADGMYGEPIQINSEAQLNGPGTKLILRVAMQQKREIVMTDPGDLTLFHAKDGKILFGGQS